MKRPRLVGVVLMLSLSVTGSVHAFSVGDIEVQSHLGQPFVGEVELEVKPHERHQEFVVVIGDENDYEAERLPRAPVIDTLWPTVMMGPPDIVRVVSEQSIDIPTFDLILLVRTGFVTILRQYRITLPAAPTPYPMAQAPVPQPEDPVRVVSVPTADRVDVIPLLPDLYGPVLRGESLHKIMQGLQVPESLMWQMAVLTWQLNPEHFVRGNMHGLHIGAYLRLPTNVTQELADLPQADAYQLVTDQWENWQMSQGLLEVAQVQAAVPPPAYIEAYADTVPMAPLAQASPGRTTIALPDEPQAEETPVTPLEAMFQGLEERLSQRFALPPLTAPGASDNTVIFVSAHELQQAIKGLEVRLTQRLEEALGQGVQIEQVNPVIHKTPPLRRALQAGAGIEAALTALLAAGSAVHVLIVQNLLLMLVGVGFAWRWYRKRT